MTRDTVSRRSIPRLENLSRGDSNSIKKETLQPYLGRVGWKEQLEEWRNNNRGHFIQTVDGLSVPAFRLQSDRYDIWRQWRLMGDNVREKLCTMNEPLVRCRDTSCQLPRIITSWLMILIDFSCRFLFLSYGSRLEFWKESKLC